MKIINRYVLKEHIGPFVFALSALTSLMLLQYIARKFGDLVGRGLSWQVITEFLLLSVPFTVALTLPMSVLVAVLYAFSRLASENEITALKAGGVSTRALMRPALVAGSILALFMLYFNDQLLPRANHELATLQSAILRTKPTFALRPQVLNTVKEGNLYLRAGQIDEASGLMRDVTIYDLADPNRRRTIYADSGTLAFAANRRDLAMRLYTGVMILAPSDRAGQLNRIYYHEETLKVRDVTNVFQSIDADSASKSDREMSICEMQKGYQMAYNAVRRARFDSAMTVWRLRDDHGVKTPMPEALKPVTAGGIGAAYCNLITKYFHVQQAQAAEVPRVRASRQPGPQAAQRAAQPAARSPAPAPAAQQPAPTPAARRIVIPDSVARLTMQSPEVIDAGARITEARNRQNGYGVEIQKKFSLAAACIVFVLVGAPLALRFPRGGVGLVIGASFLTFAAYYVALTGGESLARRNIISPFWAMWADNIVFLVIGAILIARMGTEGVSSRGGGMREAMDRVRMWLSRGSRRRAAARREARA